MIKINVIIDGKGYEFYTYSSVYISWTSQFVIISNQFEIKTKYFLDGKNISYSEWFSERRPTTEKKYLIPCDTITKINIEKIGIIEERMCFIPIWEQDKESKKEIPSGDKESKKDTPKLAEVSKVFQPVYLDEQ